MKIGITPFISENIALPNTKNLTIFNGDTKVCDVDISKMQIQNMGSKLYSFGLLADIHLWKTDTSVYSNSNTKFDNALSYFENQGCSFCVVDGDLTITGLYLRTDESDASTTYLDEGQFTAYKEIRDKHTIPVYELCGNHESYYGMPISNNLELLETHTGKGVLSYTIEQGNDLFILLGQPKDIWVMSDEDFTWLSETLEAYKDKRCFVFVHSHIDDGVADGVDDSGNPCYARENSIFKDNYWGATKRTNFINLMKQYPNAILFHGHTHMMFEAQEFDKEANFSEENGFKSVHIPSSASPRRLISADGTWQTESGESQGYIVDVYDDCIVLNGIDLINNKPVPLGTYKIDI